MALPFESLFTAAIEVGIAIAGFSGIVVVLGREPIGQWSEIEKSRMGILVRSSFATVVLGFMPLFTNETFASPTTSWAICSSLCSAYFFLAFAIRMPSVRKLRKAPDSDIGDPYFYGVVISVICVALLQIVNAGWMRTGWPYALGVLWMLIFAFTQFMRLMRVVWSQRST